MALVLMGKEVRAIPIKPKEFDFDKDGKDTIYLDKDGKRARKIQVQASEYKWVYEDGTECSGKTFKSFKNKPVSGFKKTTLVKEYDVIDKCEIKNFICNDLTYLLVSKELKKKMKHLAKDDKAISFKYVNSGFKVHRAVVIYDDKLDRVIMRCFQGDLRKADLTETEGTKEIEAESVASPDLAEIDA